MPKRLIPRTHCIELFSWRDPDHKDVHVWQEYKQGMSCSSTGAGSLADMVEKLRNNLKAGYTHFIASYPVAMQGPSTTGNPHGYSWGRKAGEPAWIPIPPDGQLPAGVLHVVLRRGMDTMLLSKAKSSTWDRVSGWTHYYPLPRM